ncbi:MAG: phosphoribosylformimino-5-aminoimidazole carboxamide ribotide isomerase [Saprospiraceae bacterium]|jgi:phosphoribosylformimino-5-aminoimidazole carboxamide ribotide isomerase
MIIYPDIEIHEGQCVNLKHGSIKAPKRFNISPLEAAKQFEQAGAEWLHVVDLDRVFNNGSDNSAAIEEIIQKVNIPVQVGGGINSSTVIDGWINAGAQRVVMGTAAVVDQRLVEEACTNHPDRIVISIDARNGKAVSNGWKFESAFSAFDLAKRFERSGAAGIIYTDIDLYDELPESNMANTTQLAHELSCPVISSGTVRSIDDVSTLSQLPNISGAVIGWALFNEKVSLEEVLSVANQKQTVAAFI